MTEFQGQSRPFNYQSLIMALHPLSIITTNQPSHTTISHNHLTNQLHQPHFTSRISPAAVSARAAEALELGQSTQAQRLSALRGADGQVVAAPRALLATGGNAMGPRAPG